jgi:ATP-dependent RNA helicase
MPPEVVQFTDNILNDPVRILIEAKDVPLDGIVQYYVELDKEEWKFDALCDIYSQLDINQAMIYCNKRQRAEWLAYKMKEAKFTLECIHGEMDVSERKKKMEDFRFGSCRVLICTDMLARGIDVQQVSLVINFELPTDTSNYIHRIGRAGRYGRKGTTINLICKDEIRTLEEIQKTYPTLNMVPLPEDLGILKL